MLQTAGDEAGALIESALDEVLDGAALTTGPMVVAVSRGSPNRKRLASSTRNGTTCSSWLSCTSMRVGAWHDWPALKKPRWMFQRAAFSRSASGSTMFADFPP